MVPNRRASFTPWWTSCWLKVSIRRNTWTYSRFPTVKSLDSFDFLALPSLNKPLVLDLARCEYVDRRENIIALGNSGTGKTHVALGLGLVPVPEGVERGIHHRLGSGP